MTTELTYRQYLLGQALQLDSREIEDIAHLDDQDLMQRFGTETEQDAFFETVSPGAPVPWKNIELRAVLEARARARLRIIEVDALLHELAKG